ncbi:MAG: tRNA (N6-isopentenyl adenosine(37)-C2)-methylthiotransferase MiaB [Candidatus Auribacterota bacterium]
MKKIFIRVWGCQMNFYDADLIRDLLLSAGYELVEYEKDAQIILLHTCSVRDMAEQKVLNKIDDLVGKKKSHKLKTIIGITGCMAENRAGDIRERYPEVNILCGPGSYTDLPVMLERACSNQGHEESLGFESDRSYPVFVPHDKRLQSYVAVMRGCNNFCSYCIVPYVRGREASRPMNEIKDEVRGLLDAGVKDITLLGQNVNSYGLEFHYNFVDLLEALNTFSEKFRIRFVTSHPKDATDELFKAMRDLDKVTPYLHLPLQSGSDRILAKMNRKYTRTDYYKKIDSAKSIVPDISLSSDFIVGFPGESEDDFKQTIEAMKYVSYDSAFIFKYSTRTGTVAATYDDDVLQSVKEERNQILLDLQSDISLKQNKGYVGKTLEVLVEGKSKRNSRRLTGRSPQFKQVMFEGDESLVGSFVSVRITRVTPLTLFGNYIDE